MHLAARAGALDVLEVLLEDLEKADRLEYVNAADKSGITPVFLAKQRGLLPSLHAACTLSSIPKCLFPFTNVIPTLKIQTAIFLAKQRGLLPSLHAACMLSSIPKHLFSFRNVIFTVFLAKQRGLLISV